VPAVVEIITERDADAAMGVRIDEIDEYEAVLEGSLERPVGSSAG
jgi:glyoxylate carboligase